MKLNNNRSWQLILSIVLIDKFIKLLLLNYSAVTQINYNIGLSIQVPGWIYVIVVLVIILVLVYLLLLTKEPLFALIIAGALANLTDRIFWGGVVDYFKLPGLFIFNIPDILITLSAIGIIIKLIKNKFKWSSLLNTTK